jgi:hypothetical protein
MLLWRECAPPGGTAYVMRVLQPRNTEDGPSLLFSHRTHTEHPNAVPNHKALSCSWAAGAACLMGLHGSGLHWYEPTSACHTQVVHKSFDMSACHLDTHGRPVLSPPPL